MAQLLLWRDTTQDHVWPFIIVHPEPACSEVLNLLDRVEQVMR